MWIERQEIKSRVTVSNNSLDFLPSSLEIKLLLSLTDTLLLISKPLDGHKDLRTVDGLLIHVLSV